MDEKRLYQVLHELGLSKREADIYLFISRKGLQKAQNIAAYLGIDRAQTYRLLRSLKQKGTIEETIETPTRYIPIPVTNLIEAHLKDKKTEIATLEAEKTNIIDYFKTVSKKEPETPRAKFQIITGRNALYTKISQMVNDAKKEVACLTTSLGLIQEDMLGILDMFIDVAQEKKSVQFKMLANITSENLSNIKNILKQVPANKANIEWRHTVAGSKHYPRYILKDDNEVLLYAMSRDEQFTSNREDNGLWVSSRMFVSTLKASFDEIWHNATNVKDRIREIETGKPMEKTLVLKEPVETQRRIEKVVKAAEKEIVLILPAVGINKLQEDTIFREYPKKGVKIRAMAPIELDNLAAAQELSKVYEVKHVSISYLTMMIVDREHLFMFKAPPLDEKMVSLFYLCNTFYTNDRMYVERTNELLNDIWKRGTAVSEIGSGGSMGASAVEVSDSATVPQIIGVMLENNVRSVLVNRDNMIVGIVDQKDLLRNMLGNSKEFSETVANEVMSMPILTIESGENIVSALKEMREKGIPRVAVMKQGKLVALLS